MAQLESNTLLLVNVADGDGASNFYFIDCEYNLINKFLNSNLNYLYSPEMFMVTLKQQTASEIIEISEASFSWKYDYYINNNFDSLFESDEIFVEKNDAGQSYIDLSIIDDKHNIQNFVVFAYLENQQIALKVLQSEYGTSEDMAKLSVNASGIVASMQDSILTFNNTGLTIKNGGFIIKQGDSPIFFADEQGNLILKGSIYSSAGQIGTWIINEHGLISQDSKVGLYSGDIVYMPDDSLKKWPVRIWAGENYEFAVNNNGKVYAKNAIISGDIVATSGHIEKTFLIGKDSSGIILYGGESGDSYISTSQFQSGANGYGWRLTQEGTAEFTNILARGKIQSSVFEYNKISSIGGSLFISPTIYTEESSSTITIDKKENTIDEEESEYISCTVSWPFPYGDLNNIQGRAWKTGDQIKFDANIIKNGECFNLTNLFGEVISVTKNQAIVLLTVSFKIASTQIELIENAKFEPGAIIILYGTEQGRQGIYLTAIEDKGPYIEVYDDLSTEEYPASAVRLGNLAGIVDADFSKSSLKGYGLYSANAYLRGELILPQAGVSNQNSIGYTGGNEYLQIQSDFDNETAIRMWAGASYPTQESENVAPFIVTQDGSLYAKKGIFQGIVRATNSEFSGTIKAAGIVIDNTATPDIKEAEKDHFFVAYKENPDNFNDYVLNINSEGLSIWQGGLKAYSDYASGFNENGYNNNIYGYNHSENNIPEPYFYLVDSGDINSLDSRMVSHKGHFFEIYKENNFYNTRSIIINNGLWFYNGTINSLNKIESNTYKNAQQYQNGLLLLNENFQLISNNNLLLNSGVNGGIYINASIEQIPSVRQEDITIYGQISIKSKENKDNLLSINKQTIKEIVKDNQSIGIDFLIV